MKTVAFYFRLWAALLLLSSSAYAQKKPTFLETFEDRNADGWATHGGAWSMEQPDGNEPHFTYKLNSGSFDKAVRTVPTITDFTVEAEITLFGGQASLLFNVASPALGGDAFQGYSVGIDAAGFVWLGKHNNSWLELGHQAQTVYLDQPYHVRAERQGATIRVYINGNLKITANDSSFPTCSMVGLRGGVNNEATFDNVLIRPFGDDVIGTTFSYQNPFSQYPVLRDPQIFKEGDRWYMIGTAAPHFFHFNAGVPIYTSKNLIDWRFEKYLVERDPSKWYNNHFWAPEVNKANGKYYVTFSCFFPNVGPIGAPGNGPPQGALAVSNSLLGPYTMLTPDGPWAVDNDSHIFQDDDGRTYLFTAGLTCAEVNLTNATRIGNTWDVVRPEQATGHWDSGHFGDRLFGLEGPSCVKRNGVYYCFFSAWGRGYEVGVATATNIRGPWTKLPNNPIFGGQEEAHCIASGNVYTQNPAVPYRGAGHNSIFTGPDGQDWIIAHMEERSGPPRLCMDPISIGGGTVSTTSKNPAKATGPSWDLQTINLTPGVQSPYPGPNPTPIPGIVEAENFDNGGEGVAYHDTTIPNQIGPFRVGERVDTEPCSEGGENVAFSDNGEWLEYTVNVATAGAYTMAARISSPFNTGNFHIEMDGTNITGAVGVPNTGGWQSWQTVNKTVNLTAGQHVMRFFIDAKEFNTNKFTFTAQGNPQVQMPFPGPNPAPIPGVVEAENFDNGGEGVAYHDIEETNQGGVGERSGPDVFACSEGGLALGWVGTGEWMEYTVNAATAGSYTINARIASVFATGVFHLEWDGNNISNNIAVPNTGDWQTWQSVTKTVTLTAGQHVLRVFADAGNFNLNKITFSTGGVNNDPFPVSGSVYRLVNRQSGKVLDVNECALTNGMKVQQWTWLGGNCQRWKFTATDNGYFKITAQHSNQALEIGSALTTDGAKANQWPSNDCFCQQWKVEATSGGFYKLTARHSTQVLEVGSALMTDGAQVNQFPWNTAACQQWAIEPIAALARQGVEEVASPSLKLSPNPASDLVEVSWENVESEGVSITIVDMKGAVVYSSAAKTGNSMQLQTGNFQSGIYAVHLKGNRMNATQKLMINR
ncbi:MAG: carbohydrate-binding protein [Bacteroidota bacterium]